MWTALVSVVVSSHDRNRAPVSQTQQKEFSTGRQRKSPRKKQWRFLFHSEEKIAPNADKMAERVGFEPTDPVSGVNVLAGRPIQPYSGTSPRCSG